MWTGVLTDGNLLLLDDGQQARTMYIRDGYALQLAVRDTWFWSYPRRVRCSQKPVK